MIKFQIRHQKTSHPIYEYIKENTGVFCSHTDLDPDVFIIALDCHIMHVSYPQIMVEVKSTGKPYYIYMEHFVCIDRDYLGIDLELFDSYLNDENFKGFITHMRDTEYVLKSLHNHPVYYFSVGVNDLSNVVLKKRLERLIDKKDINLLFWGSWLDTYNSNFYGRGGMMVDGIFNILASRFDNVFLDIKSPCAISSQATGRVRMYRDILSYEDLCNLHFNSDIFLLPGEQVHAATVPFAMSFGLPVIGNDEWGMSEYIDHDQNGLAYKNDKDYIQNCADKISEWVVDRDRLLELSMNAASTQRSKFSSKKHDLDLYGIIK